MARNAALPRPVGEADRAEKQPRIPVVRSRDIVVSGWLDLSKTLPLQALGSRFESRITGVPLHRGRFLPGALVFACASALALLGSAAATAVPYPLPPGYLSSYDQGYDTMAPIVGSKYFFNFSSPLAPACQEELRIAQSKNAPQSNEGFLAGCKDAARHAIGIYYPCDRNGDDPVCPRRP